MTQTRCHWLLFLQRSMVPPMPKKKTASLIPVQRIEQSILLIREQRIILDEDLAAHYGVPTKRLNEQMKRNRERFPADFVFQLSKEEFAILKSHSATASWGGRRSPPYAFTEHGTLMAVVRGFCAYHFLGLTGGEFSRSVAGQWSFRGCGFLSLMGCMPRR